MKILKELLISSLTVFSLFTPAYASVPGVTDGMEGASKGIVAVSHPAAAEAGKRILEQGGNAIDAASAIQFALNVVEPHMSGIGGGGFMMIYLKEQNRITILDSREMAPKKAYATQFLDKDGKPIEWFSRHTNGKAVGVPGTLLGVKTALDKYGTMKLPEVIEPAIELAEKGVKVNWTTARHIGEEAAKLQQYKTAGKVFVPGGKPLAEGDLLVQPDLAKTLRLIKEKGPDVFYKGEIGQVLVDEVQKRGGLITMDDLKNYVVKEREPIRANFRGYEVVTVPPPSSGGLTVLQILKLMEGFDNEKDGPNSPTYLHHLIEAMHLAYADLAAYMADEDFHPVPKAGLINEQYIGERRKLIDEQQAGADASAGDPWRFEKDAPPAAKQVSEQHPTGQTTHFSIMDKWGNLVAYTTTIEEYFGSGIMVPGYGFMLNNEMTDFDAQPGGVNQVEPGKRPRSSMSPTMILKDGKPIMAIGSSGGPTIMASVAQTILNVIDHKLPIQQAITTPNIFSSSYPKIDWETGIGQDVILQLMAKGHRFVDTPDWIGNVQAVIFDAETGKMYGGADNSREGTVKGVDAVSFVAPKPEPMRAPEKGAFSVTLDGYAFPFAVDQLLLRKGVSYVQADKLLLALNGKAADFQKEYTSINGKTYLPVAKVARALGYQVSWDQKAVVELKVRQEQK